MTGILILAGTAVVYALLCLARPHHACSRCKGKRVTRNRKGRRSRCRSCKGAGMKVRPGARLVHSFYQHVKGEPDRAGRMDRINRVQAQAEHDRKAGAIEELRARVAVAGYAAGHEAGAAAAQDDNERQEP